MSTTKPPSMTASEVGALLRGLALLFRAKPLSNPQAESALEFLSRKLSALGDRPLESVFEEMKGRKSAKRLPPSDEQQRHYATMNESEIRRFISDPAQTKQSLLQFAAIRFGMPVGNLIKMPRRAVVERIKRVMENEGAISIIARQARQSGQQRS